MRYVFGLIAFGILLFILFVAAGEDVEHRKQSCIAAGGHFVANFHDECYSADGSRRLFPEGF